MARQRSEKTWKTGAGQEPAIDAEEIRKCERDFKFFYSTVLSQTIRDRRGGTRRQSLSRIHDFMLDFLNLEELEALHEADAASTYSPLLSLLPLRDVQSGEWAERWIYWKTLDGPAEIQDGPDGPISEMFHGRFWQGLIIRVKGNGLTKCLLMPRGHLKSTLATQGHMLWSEIRDPSERALITSQVYKPLALDFVRDVKWHYEQNPRFRARWGHLMPANKELPWNADFFQIRTTQRRGKEPTLRGVGVDSGTTGGHYDRMVLDDVVGERNYQTAEMRGQVRTKVMQLQAVRDPDTPLLDVGTRWAEDDAHSLFTGKDSELAEDTCFFVATALDGDESVPAPKSVTPLAYGKPIWPEKFSLRTLERYRRVIQDDRLWFGFFFNQFAGTAAHTFHPSWKTWYEGIPREVAAAKRLNIYFGVDTASGMTEQKGTLDPSAGLVLGQTPDRMEMYLLDGFSERLAAGDVVRAIAEMFLKWREVAKAYGGICRCGCEENAYTNFLAVALDLDLRARGVESSFRPEGIKCDKRAKPERIRLLAPLYEARRILWPHELWVTGTADPYNFMERLQGQWDAYGAGGLAHEDVLDAHARAVELAPPPPWKDTPAPAVRPATGDDGIRPRGGEPLLATGLDRYLGKMKRPWER